MRVFLAAVAFTAFSFAVGVAGDLTRPEPAHGEAVVVRIPPAIPADAPRAAPLPLLRTASAAAETPRRAPRQLAVAAAVVTESPGVEPKPWAERLLLRSATKVDELAEAKAKSQKQGE